MVAAHTETRRNVDRQTERRGEKMHENASDGGRVKTLGFFSCCHCFVVVFTDIIMPADESGQEEKAVRERGTQADEASLSNEET